MTGLRAYLDYNASAPLLPVARAAMIAALDASANPSSVHGEGRNGRRIVETARSAVASLVNGKAEHVVFTSGASEAASMLLTPDWKMGRAAVRMSRLYVSAADHPCLRNGGRFSSDHVVRIGVDGSGLCDLKALQAALAGHDESLGLPLVAIHLANNETGVIQPVDDIAAIVRAAGGVLVLDAVQAAGRLPLDMTTVNADYLILSSHKIGGPQGAGAIVAASDLMMPTPLITGGGQERGHRGGTENMPAIAGFGAAARNALAELSDIDSIRSLRDRIEAAVIDLAPDAQIFGNGAPRLANTTFFAIPGFKAETAQIGFDLSGVAVSAGSACSSGRTGPSHVLNAMGFVENAGALRVSIGSRTTMAELEIFRSALSGILDRLSGRATKAA